MTVTARSFVVHIWSGRAQSTSQRRHDWWDGGTLRGDGRMALRSARSAGRADAADRDIVAWRPSSRLRRSAAQPRLWLAERGAVVRADLHAPHYEFGTTAEQVAHVRVTHSHHARKPEMAQCEKRTGAPRIHGVRRIRTLRDWFTAMSRPRNSSRRWV